MRETLMVLIDVVLIIAMLVVGACEATRTQRDVHCS